MKINPQIISIILTIIGVIVKHFWDIDLPLAELLPVGAYAVYLQGKTWAASNGISEMSIDELIDLEKTKSVLKALKTILATVGVLFGLKDYVPVVEFIIDNLDTFVGAIGVLVTFITSLWAMVKPAQKEVVGQAYINRSNGVSAQGQSIYHSLV